MAMAYKAPVAGAHEIGAAGEVFDVPDTCQGSIALDIAPGADFNGVHGTVDEVVFSGATVSIGARLGDGSTLAVSIKPV